MLDESDIDPIVGDEQPLNLSTKSYPSDGSLAESPTKASTQLSVRSQNSCSNPVSHLLQPPLALPICQSYQAFKVKPQLSSITSRQKYTKEELKAALQDIQSGKLGTRRAAVIYRIPRSTLRNKVYKLALEKGANCPGLDDHRVGLDESAPSDDRQLKNTPETKVQEKWMQQEPSAKEERQTLVENIIEGFHQISREKPTLQDETESSEPWLSENPNIFTTPQLFLQWYKNSMSTTNTINATSSTNTSSDKSTLLQRNPSLSIFGPATGTNPHVVSMFNLKQLQDLHRSNLLAQHPADAHSKQLLNPEANPLFFKPMQSITDNDAKHSGLGQDMASKECTDSSPRSFSDGQQDPINSTSGICQRLVLPLHSKNSTGMFASCQLSEDVEERSTLSPPWSSSEPSAPVSTNHQTNINLYCEAIANIIGLKFHQPYELSSLLQYNAGRSISCEDQARIAFPILAASSVALSKSHTDEELLYTSKVSPPSSGSICVASTGKGARPKRGKYRNYDCESLVQAVRAVQRGEMTVHRAGSHFGVPHSTLEYKVKERHLMRPRKRGHKIQPLV